MLQKNLHITPKMSCFSFTYVIIKTTMLLECSLKNYATWKLTYFLETLEQSPLKVLGEGLYFIPWASCPKFLSKILATLNTLKMWKASIISSLVPHPPHPSPRPATVKGWEKKVFWKIRALGNLKYNKSNNLKSR